MAIYDPIVEFLNLCPSLLPSTMELEHHLEIGWDSEMELSRYFSKAIIAMRVMTEHE